MRYKNLFFVFILLVFISSCDKQMKEKNVYVMDTDHGNIYIEIYPDKAPKTCAAFIRNVADGIFDNSSFYRIVKSENVPPKYDNGVIQGGIYESDIKLKQALPFIQHEPPSMTGISHEAGTISMARLAPGTAQSEFFICVGDQQQFDSSRSGNPDGLGYAAFGTVIKGYGVVKKIHQQKNIADAFVRSVKINSIRKL